MEIQNTITSNYGECRCCLAKGNHQNITKEYYYNGIREVFVDVFMECFNLCLSTNSGLSSLICASCVSRLRDASDFRMMVASTETQLLNALAHPDNKHTILINVQNTDETGNYENYVKVETVKEEPPDTDELENDDLDCMVGDCDADECTVEGEEALLARFSLQELKPLPTRRQLHKICPEYANQLKLLHGNIVKPSAIKKLLNNNENNGKEKPKLSEKYGQIVNTNTILEFSNAIPFRTRIRSGFACFYCSLVFENLSKLREHSIKHDKSEIINLLKAYMPYRLVVNIDVTDLKCSICNEAMQSVNTLKTHLTEVHKKEMHVEYTDRVIPFKSVNDIYECQVCGSNFETFRAVDRHMNMHYNNYLCSECGMGFVTQYRLHIHSYTHGEGMFPCDQCKQVLTTKQKLKMHVNIKHNRLKRYKCLRCAERFTEYTYRQRHMVEVHGIAPTLYKCNECDKSFNRRFELARHTKRNHLAEKDRHCTICSYKCFSLNELKLHMIKHTGEKKFECTICKKSLSRMKSLKEHMKIHNNDRRFVCASCGQAFVQKCSLKGHMKTHHRNLYDI